MTKTQIKSRLKKIKELLEEQKMELESLNEEIQETIDEIEPYGDSYELTAEQEDRQEWLEDCYSDLESECWNLEGIIDVLDNVIIG